MTGQAVPATERDPEPSPPRQPGPGIGRAAALIAALTVLARLIGLGRQLVFAHTVGSACLGTAYTTANLVPNVIYDIVLGGALTGLVVPLLARPAALSGTGLSSTGLSSTGLSGTGLSSTAGLSGTGLSGTRRPGGVRDTGSPEQPSAQAPAGPRPAGPQPAAEAADHGGAAEVSQISSALLTWTVLVLVPASVIIAAFAGPAISLLVPGSLHGCPRAEVVSVGGRMLAVFAPQIVLYGLAVVLYGIVQAHRRFTAPALAPVLSSLVVIAAYLAFVPLGGQHVTHLAGLSAAAELTLSVGTTAGVAALVVTALVPAWRLRLRLRPALRFPPGVARRARGLAAVGIIAVIAQDASVVVVTWLANGHGGTGAVVLYNYGWQVFTSAYAVLAIPIAVSAFPALSARDGDRFNDVAATSSRAVLLMSWLGTAVLTGIAVPAARVFAGRVNGLSAGASAHQAGELAAALAVLAPGLVGYGLVACLFRVLLADGRNRIAATLVPAGWLLVIAVDLVAVPLASPGAVVPVLAAANTAGLTVAAVALLVAVRRVRGRGALGGTARAFAAGLAGALAGALAGGAVSASIHAQGTILNALLALLSAVIAVIVFAVVAYRLDGPDLRLAVARLRRRAA